VVVTANERQTHTIRSLQQQLDELNGRLFDEESRYKQVDFALKRQVCLCPHYHTTLEPLSLSLLVCTVCVILSCIHV